MKKTINNKNKRRVIKDNFFFIIPTMVFWIAGVVFVCLYSQVELHKLIAGYRTEFLDAVMPYYTEVGGFLPWLVVVGLLFYRFGHALLVLISQLLSIIVVRPLKHFIDADRPRRVFEQIHSVLPHVEGVKLHSAHSFPSGHTASAFACLFALALLVKNPLLKILFFLLALFTAYSRVYLSQHFTEDVLVGSVIGVLVTYIYYIYHQKFKATWLEKSLLSLK